MDIILLANIFSLIGCLCFVTSATLNIYMNVSERKLKNTK